MRPPAAVAAPARPPADGAFAWIVVAAATAAGLVWAGGAVASVLAGGPVPGLAQAAEALVVLPGRAADPSSAWPAGSVGDVGPVAYWAAQGVVLAGAVALAAAGWWLWDGVGAGAPGALGVRGEGRLARRRDLGRLVVAGPVPGRLTLGRAAGRLVACEERTSLAVIGPTGCGKTAGFAIPALLEWSGPVIATSVKSDLLEATIAHRRRRGTVWVYDPTSCAGQGRSHWSPLAACRTWPGAMRTAAAMVEAAQPRQDSVSDGDYWYSQARKALAPYLFAAARAGAALGDLVRWVDTQERGEVEAVLSEDVAAVAPGLADPAGPAGLRRWAQLWAAVEAIYRSMLAARGGPQATLARLPLESWPDSALGTLADVVEAEWHREAAALAAGGGVPADLLAPLVAARALWSKEARLRGSVFATVENVLAPWADPGVAACATEPELDVDQWLSGDHTIFVVAAAHDQARLRPVLTVLVGQAVRAAYDAANRSPGATLVRPCLVMIDEAGNTAPLRDLPQIAATGRSHGITLVTVWQDLAQITATYRDRAQTVLNNHRARLFGSGIADAATLDYLSRLVGDEHRLERNVSVDLAGGRRSLSEHRTWRRTAPADVLRRLPENHAVLLYGAELPVHLQLRPWFTDAGLAERAGRPDLIRRSARV